MTKILAYINAATFVHTVHLSVYMLVITSAVLSKIRNLAIKSVYMVMYQMQVGEKNNNNQACSGFLACCSNGLCIW